MIKDTHMYYKNLIGAHTTLTNIRKTKIYCLFSEFPIEILL